MAEKPRRRLFNFYMAEAGHQWLEKFSKDTGADKSTIVRLSMAVARNHEKELRSLIANHQEQS